MKKHKGASSGTEKENRFPDFQERLNKCAEIVGNAAKLADAAGISRPTMGDYLSGKSDPSRQRLIRIAQAAGVSLAWLATGKGPEGPDDYEQAVREDIWHNYNTLSDKTVRETVAALVEYLGARILEGSPEEIGRIVVALSKLHHRRELDQHTIRVIVEESPSFRKKE